MKKTLAYNYQGYVNSKGFLNYGIPTAVICLIINYFSRGAAVPLVAVGPDLMITVFLTVLICTLTGVPGINAEVRKNAAPKAPMNKWDHPFYSHFSDKLLPLAVQFALFSTLIFGMIPSGILATVASISGNLSMAIDPITYFIVKSLYCGVFISFAMRWVTACVLAQKTCSMK